MRQRDRQKWASLFTQPIAAWKVLNDLLGGHPFKPESITADAGYSVGSLREHLDAAGIPSYIPLKPQCGIVN